MRQRNDFSCNDLSGTLSSHKVSRTFSNNPQDGAPQSTAVRDFDHQSSAVTVRGTTPVSTPVRKVDTTCVGSAASSGVGLP